jgi:hypothetical protein
MRFWFDQGVDGMLDAVPYLIERRAPLREPA